MNEPVQELKFLYKSESNKVEGNNEPPGISY